MHAVFLDAATMVPIFQGETMEQKHWDISNEKLNAAVDDCFYFSNSTNDQVIERCKNAEIVITNKVILNEQTLIQLPKLRLACIAATGTNNVDLLAAKKLGIVVCNVAGYSTPSVVQLTFSLMLALQSKLLDLHCVVKKGDWQQHHQFALLPSAFFELSGKTLGILGFGTIGQSVAKVAESFGMTVKIAQLPGRPEDECKIPLEDLLPQCDVLSLHCPHSDSTAGLVNQSFLAKMKPSAILINTARGALINEFDLAQALRKGIIAGAGLDVLSVEPPSDDNPLMVENLPNLLITPHIAWASFEARQRLIDELAENIVAFKDNRSRNRVNS